MKKYKKLNEDVADDYLNGFYKAMDSAVGSTANDMVADNLKKQDLHSSFWGGISQYQKDINDYKSGSLEPLSRLDPSGFQKFKNEYEQLKQIAPESAENLKNMI